VFYCTLDVEVVGQCMMLQFQRVSVPLTLWTRILDSIALMPRAAPEAPGLKQSRRVVKSNTVDFARCEKQSKKLE
jgi:hypothetical protein